MRQQALGAPLREQLELQQVQRREVRQPGVPQREVLQQEVQQPVEPQGERRPREVLRGVPRQARAREAQPQAQQEPRREPPLRVQQALGQHRYRHQS